MDEIATTAELVLDYNGAVFHATTWVVAYLAGIARQIRDDSAWDPWDSLRRGCFSGFLGFAAIAIVRGYHAGPVGDLWYFIGLAAGVGLLGKEGEKLLLFVIHSSFKRIGIRLDERSRTVNTLGHRPDPGRNRIGNGDEK